MLTDEQNVQWIQREMRNALLEVQQLNVPWGGLRKNQKYSVLVGAEI
jgi:hypothetical protein